jgi:hypothetical protein
MPGHLEMITMAYAISNMMMITVIINIKIIIIIITITTETDKKCRLCQQFYEAVHHFISACPTLSKQQYEK